MLCKIKCQAMADEIADLVRLSPMLYNAFCQVNRELFVPVSHNAYKLIPNPIASRQWISSPLTVAKMTMALECENVDNVLEIGCGSGYQAVILSKLARRVFSVERIEILVKDAKKRIEELEIRNVNIKFDDGNLGWDNYGPYDRILFSCACESAPEGIFSQLKVGGILVAPLKENTKQFITKFIKKEDTIEKITLEECEFVPLLSGREWIARRNNRL